MGCHGETMSIKVKWPLLLTLSALLLLCRHVHLGRKRHLPQSLCAPACGMEIIRLPHRIF